MLNKMTTPGEVFHYFFNQIMTSIDFNPAWKNGTGYMDGLIHGPYAPVLKPGEIHRCKDDMCRLMIIIGTPLGNFTVFQRYSESDDVFTYNTTREFTQAHLIDTGAVGFHDMKRILGDPDDALPRNIGEWLLRLNGLMKIACSLTLASNTTSSENDVDNAIQINFEDGFRFKAKLDDPAKQAIPVQLGVVGKVESESLPSDSES